MLILWLVAFVGILPGRANTGRVSCARSRQVAREVFCRGPRVRRCDLFLFLFFLWPSIFRVIMEYRVCALYVKYIYPVMSS